MKIKKTLLPTIMSGLILFSTTACGGLDSSSVATGESAIIWSALSTEKFMQDERPDSYTDAQLDFVGMKGETTAMQLMITANEYIKSFDLEVGDLTSEDGAVFSAENFAVYAERYVEMAIPYSNNIRKGTTIYAEPGFYPDALVPLDRYIANREARVEEGNNQGIWVDCVIPADATAGSYSGTFTLSYGDKTEEIPVTLFVYDLTMPEEVHSITFFGLWYEQLAYGEGDNYTTDTNRIYYDFLASKRVSSDDVPGGADKNITTFIEFISEVADNPKVTTYVCPFKLTGVSEGILSPSPGNETKYTEAQQTAEAEKLQKSLANIIGKILEKNLSLRAEEGKENIDLLKKLFFAIEDEPGSEYRLKKVRIMGERLTAAKRDVLENYAAALEEHPDLAESISRIEQYCASNGINANLSVSSKNEGMNVYEEGYEPDYEKGDGLTFWCPEGYKFKDTAFREQVKYKQALGERFIWYNCCSTSPTFSYYLETVPVSIRMYSWVQYQYGIEGILYWDTVHWTTTNAGDPYEDLSHSNGWGAGEGILLYPGVKYGLKTPISSIRLEQIFHGQQDYEYLYMLDQYLTANEIDVTAAEIITPLLVNLHRNSMTLETAEGSELETGRIKVLDLLQDFAKGDVAAAQAKIDAILG